MITESFTLHFNHTTSTVVTGNPLIEQGTISQQCASLGQHFVIISDQNVAPLYAKPLQSQLEALHKTCTMIVIGAGEDEKSRQNKQWIEDQMLAAHCDRHSIIIAVGGGVVTDLAGFVAATYYRGIQSVYVPTTLLAMVDAAIGGKTAVNTAYGKNLIGSFHQPTHVFCDSATLTTLSMDHIADGLVETIKHALIQDREFFDELQPLLATFANKQRPSLSELNTLINQSCQIKAQIVTLDEKEQGGIRQLLNFGHTAGHAIERELDYQISHGQAVLAGLWIASTISHLCGYLAADDLALIKKNLANIHYQNPVKIDLNQQKNMIQHMAFDKKNKNNDIYFVLLDGIGQAHSKDHQYSFAIAPDMVRQAIALWIQEQPCNAN